MPQRGSKRPPRSRADSAADRFTARLRSVGEQGLVVELGDAIEPRVNARVHWLAEAVTSRHGSEVIEVVPTYRSLLVVHDPLRIPRAQLEARIQQILADAPQDAALQSAGRLVRVPACYGGELGPDLEALARDRGLTPEEAISLHSGATYRVYMLGFTPGFPYLGGVPARLATPRLEVPRQLVPAGSIGIAGEQTGIYPVASPGGWRLVARTPLRLFDPSAAAPFLFAAGDRVRFEPIDRQRFDRIASEVAAGEYAPSIEAAAGAER